jgi:hypothetical protein
MEALLAWRAYPAVALLVVGLGVAVWGLHGGVAGARRAARDPGRALALLRGFRVGVIGLALAGLGAAWWWQLGWLAALSLIIGGEELLESTVIITALRSGAGSSVSTSSAVAR